MHGASPPDHPGHPAPAPHHADHESAPTDRFPGHLQGVPPDQQSQGAPQGQGPATQGHSGQGQGEGRGRYDSPYAGPYAGQPTGVSAGDSSPGGPTPWPPGHQPQSGHPRQRSGRLQFLVAALIVGVLAGFGGAYTADQMGLIQGSDENRTIESRTVLADGSGTHSVVDVSAAVMPSVVSISVGGGPTGGVGSGFVVREDGYIVTNAHVIEPAIETSMPIAVHFANGDQYPAEISGHDLAYDVAVIKVEATELPVLEFGDSDALVVGEQVVAVGAPLGLDSTVTTGIVSALERPVMTGQGSSTAFINAVQTDAAINPGNSGGPLVNLNGDVVGVNTAMAQVPDMAMTGAVGSIGLGFAIPANQAEHTANQLIETGESNHPVIGILVDPSYTGEGARIATESEDGVDIIVPDGAAEAAGLQPGDLILEVDGRTITDSSHLIVVLRSYQIGDEVEVLVRAAEGDEERTVTMTLQGS